jgi:1,4-alpha-glucan branching enzyme
MARLVGASVLRDSLVDRALVLAIRDTLRVVHFAFEAPAAARVALVGDFTRWDTNEVALDRSGKAWRADVNFGAGRHRYGFVVDDTQWVAMADRTRAVADTI